MKSKQLIKSILKEELSKILNEDFKSQRNNFISQINSPNADTIVDRYLNDFKEIKDNKYAVAANAELEGLNVKKGNDRFDIDKYKTFKELETFVDYVSGQVKVGSANFEDIKVDGKPIYEDKEVEIYYADTPRACIQYKGKLPYSWCVSRTDASNMFYDYRLKEHEPAFYFVKRKKAMDKEFKIWNIAGTVFSGEWKDKYHFFVIQVVKNADIKNKTQDQYYVTSAANDGDKPMNWDNILELAPELNGLQDIFTPKPLTEKEREKINKYSKGLSDEEFAKLPYKEKEYYIAVYVKINKHLTDNQFKNLPEDLKNKYVGLGVGLSDGQFDMIKDTKLLKRYVEITKRKFDAFFKTEKENEVRMFVFQPSEFKFLDYDMLKKGELSSRHISILLQYSQNKDEIAKMIINVKGDRLDSNDMLYLLKYSQNKDEIAKMIINARGDTLDSNDILYLLRDSQNRDEIVKLIANAKGDKLDSNDIEPLLKNSQNPIQITKIIGIDKVTQLLSELDPSDTFNLLRVSKNQDEIVKLIINAKGDKLNSYEIFNLLNYSKNPIQITKIIGIDKVNQLLSELKSYEIDYLVKYSQNRDEIAKMIVNARGDKLKSDDIKSLLQYSPNKDEIKNQLIQAGVDRSLIPESKKTIKKVLREYIK